MRISKRMMIGLLSGMISLGLMMAWLGFTRTGKNTEESLGTINVTPLSQASTVVEQAQVLETFNLSQSVNVAFVDGENTVEPDASLHWENLYEVDWTTEDEMAAEIDRQWGLAAEWGYTRPSEAAALIDYLLDSGVIAGTAVPRQFSEIEEILPPRHDGEIAILVGSAGLTSLQEDDAGNWRYFPLASELGQVANGMVIGGQLFFSGADGGFYQWGGEETAERVWEDGAVFDSWHDETSQQTYLATNRGVWLSELAGESRLISTTDLFAWSITQDRNGDLWVSGERTIQDASVKTFNEAGLWESADGTQSVREGVILRLIDGEWISMGVFPDDPIIREIVAGEINGQEMIVARGHKRAYLFDAAKGVWDVLLDQPVSSLLISQDVLYLGTEDSRLLVHRQGDFESLLLAAEADGIFLLDLAMLPDGRLLAGTQAGVYVIDLQSGEIRHTDQRGVSESRTQVGKRAAQMPEIVWCNHGGFYDRNYVWYDIGEHNINGNSTAIEFQMGAYSSNNLDLYPWHSAVGEARKVMWYCDGSQVRARSWKGCNGYDDCYDHMILSDHLNGNGDHVGGGVSCNHDYYAAVWSDIPGYQFQIGRTVGKTDVNGVTTSNNNRYNAAVELVPSDFGDLRAEEESDFPTADVFFRQHVAHTETGDQVRSGDWNGEQLPNYEDGDDDGLEVYIDGAWRHPEAVTLSMGNTYRFRVRSQSHGAWYWQPETFINVYGDWNGVGNGFAIVDTYKGGQLIGDYEFEVIIPTNSILNPWLRVTLSQEEPIRIWDTWAEDKNTYIMGEIEDYRLTVSGGTDLEVTKIDTADPVMLGDMIDYDITVQNNGPVIANDVRLVDELPAGTEFVSATGGGFACTQNGDSTVTCLRDSIAVGDAHTVRLRLRTADETIAQVTNVATVSMLNDDLVPENNRDTEVTTIEQLADVAIDKQDSADPVYPDQPFQYILTVRNNGPHTARDVTVTDTVPNGIVLNRATGSGFSCQISGQALRCTRPSLLAGQQVAISVDVLSGDQIGVVTNTAEATTSTPEQIVWNNTATENTTILEITDLEISKTDVQDPVVVGETLQWRLVATNVGPQPAENVVIEDTLPDGLVYLSHRTNLNDGATDWSCQATGGAVRCVTPLMPVGQVATIEIFAAVPGDFTADRVENLATIQTTTAETTLTNNTGRETTEIYQLIDLVIEKTDNIDPVIAGDTLIWSFAVSNNGPSVARQVTLQDTLPPQLTPADVQFLPNSSWTCTATTMSCVLNDDLPPNSFAPLLQLSAVITDAYGDELINSVAVTAVEPEFDPSNNVDTESTIIGQYIRRVPPSGYLFLHARYSEELGWADEGERGEEDYLASDLIVNPLQVPVDIGLAFHAEEAAYLCLSLIDPCPAGETILGVTEVLSYAIDSFVAISPTAAVDVTYIGEQGGQIGRMAEANFVNCTGDCVAYGLHQEPNYSWAETAYYTLVQTSQGGRQIECDQCAHMADAAPGYYQLTGTVYISVSYPSYETLNQRYELPGVFTFQIVAPFINDR